MVCLINHLNIKQYLKVNNVWFVIVNSEFTVLLQTAQTDYIGILIQLFA